MRFFFFLLYLTRSVRVYAGGAVTFMIMRGRLWAVQAAKEASAGVAV